MPGGGKGRRKIIAFGLCFHQPSMPLARWGISMYSEEHAG